MSVSAIAYPHATDAAVSARMRRNRKVDTNPEVRLRSALHRLGLRYRKHYPIVLPERTVRPDIVFPRQRVAVFVDGCFWHRCPEHGNRPLRNVAYWDSKLERNVSRDAQVDAALAQNGWQSIRVWEHEDASVASVRLFELIASLSGAPQTLGGEAAKTNRGADAPRR
jgi:DNA mismatch endonuclease (patch repair protein)